MVAAVQSETVFAKNAALSAMEAQDLSWFFDGAEGSFGVRSNFGAMEDELVRRSLSEDVLIDLAKEARRRAALKRLKQESRELEPGLQALYAAAGLTMPPPPKPPAAEDLLPDWAHQYMHVSPAASFVDSNPTVDLKLARRATHTRNRLIRVGTNWTGVLYAAHGPAAARWDMESKGNPNHPVTKLGDPALGEISMAILAFEHQHDREPPSNVRLYELLHNACATAKGVLELRNKALDLRWAANTAFLATRCPLPPQVHKTRVSLRDAIVKKACPRCWPQ